MLWVVALLAGLVVVLLVVVVLLARRGAGDRRALRSEVGLAVDERLVAFQSAIQQSVGSTRQDVAQTSAALQASVVEMHRVMTGLDRTVAALVGQQQGAVRLAEDLKVLLQGPKLRGGFAEEILEEMLERVLPRGIWRRQCVIAGGGTVDAAVEFKGLLFPIDAKFPRDDYERYVEAESDDERRRAWRAYEAAIRTQVGSIARKYVRPEAGTAEFALMFIPSEAVYYETIAHRNALDEPNPLLAYAHARKVIPVGPSTLFAFLQVILVAARNSDLLANARRLQESLKGVEQSFDWFGAQFEAVGKHLEQADEAYRKGEGHFHRFRERVGKVLALEFEEAPPGREERPIQAAAGGGREG